MPVFKPPFGTPLNTLHPLATSMVGCYVFNEPAGSNITDLVAGANAAPAGSVPPTLDGSDPSGGGATLHGSDADVARSYYEAGTPALTTDLAAGPASWFVRFNIPALCRGSFCERTAGSNTGGWVLGPNEPADEGSLALGIAYSVSHVTGLIRIPFGGWHNLVVVYDGTLNGVTAIKFYLDGVFAPQPTGLQTNGTGVLASDATEHLRFGRNEFTFKGSIQASLSTIVMWKNRMLTAQDAASLHTDPWTYLRPFVPPVAGGGNSYSY